MKTKMNEKQTKKMKEMMMISTSSKSAHDRNQLCQNSGDLLSSDPSSNKKKQISPKIFQFKTFEKQMQSCRCHCFWDWQKILSDKWGDINFGMKLFQRNADKQILSLKNKKKFSFRPTFWVNKVEISKIWSGLKLVGFVSRTDPMMNRQYQILCYITPPMSCVLNQEYIQFNLLKVHKILLIISTNIFNIPSATTYSNLQRPLCRWNKKSRLNIV
jgi:hypothetical protein